MIEAQTGRVQSQARKRGRDLGGLRGSVLRVAVKRMALRRDGCDLMGSARFQSALDERATAEPFQRADVRHGLLALRRSLCR